MKQEEGLPPQALIRKALLEVLKQSTSALHILEIETAVAQHLNLSKSQIEIMHKGNRTMLGYKLAWARTAAKKQGLIESPRGAYWKIKN